jgi:4-carboxymuconolactone decarboxylase
MEAKGRPTTSDMAQHEQKLLSLALHDEQFIESVLATPLGNVEASSLDERSHALVRLGALLALDAPTVSYQWGVDAALAAGATPDQVVGTLIAVAPVIGIARAVAAAEQLALPLGYDLDSALEGFNGREG